MEIKFNEVEFKVGDIVSHSKTKCLMKIVEIPRPNRFKVWLEDIYGRFTEDSFVSHLLEEDIKGVSLVCRDGEKSIKRNGREYMFRITFPEVLCSIKDSKSGIVVMGKATCSTCEDRFNINIGESIALCRAEVLLAKRQIEEYNDIIKERNELLEILTK